MATGAVPYSQGVRLRGHGLGASDSKGLVLGWTGGKADHPLGTSNKFHFFYQWLSITTPLRGLSGEPFIVATDNVAAVVVGRDKEPDTTPPPPSDVALAIGGLAHAVSQIDANTSIHVAVEATLDTKELTDHRRSDRRFEVTDRQGSRQPSELTVKALVGPR